eukprot:CAMPEP_0196175182 /NCGR_PEP_ID=MMETSP0911-20130528/7900_1 /TAXON_ID=49265 /ORGANISM="Thalassiosira rotula, Strain GSO102" /LENGTH=66 /DNA_ID=CAMNT_0041442685 /DNA_START=199 /DNA_END=399 /DNA_ORIENTATION=+
MTVLAYAYVISGNISYQQYNEIDGLHYEHKCRRHFVSHWIRQEDQGVDAHDRWAWTIGQIAFWPKG